MFDHSEETHGITLDDNAKANMLEIGRWGKFLAIVSIVMMVLVVLIGVASMTSLSSLASSYPGGAAAFGGFFLLFFYLVIIALYIYPTYALYKYSTMIKEAIQNDDQFTFNEAFRHLKGAFKYMGILMLVVICIYALMFVFAGAAMFLV